MLRIVQSNDLEVLVQHLLREADAQPFDGPRPESFIVPSLGFGRWLKARIAARRGIAANIETPYAAQWVWQQFASVLPDVDQHSPFDGERMQLRIFGHWQQLPDDADHARLRRWLASQDATQQMALAAVVSRTFQGYLVYRPDWLWRWARGERCGLGASEGWQQRLWQALLAAEPNAGPQHPAEAYFRRLQQSAQQSMQQSHTGALVPPAVRLIGISSLPPLYLDIFHRLSRFTEVTLYWLNPCERLWTDLQPQSLRAALATHAPLELPTVGHALLASWGQQARDQLARFVALEDTQGVADARAFITPPGTYQLARLKRSLLTLEAMAVTPANAADDSIRLHDCHSLTRQLEVLHDALLHRFAADATLRPADVLVLLPDLDAAADLIDAVWGAMPPDRALPFAVSGRHQPGLRPLPAAALASVALLGSRWAAPEVLALLRRPVVAARFGFAETDFALLESWLAAAGIHWGADTDQQVSGDWPLAESLTWAQGLERLLLGFAQPLEGRAFSGGVLPVDAIAGSQRETLGRLLQALTRLEEGRRFAQQVRPLGEWCTWLLDWLDRLLLPAAEDLADEQALRGSITALDRQTTAAQLATPVPLAVVSTLVQQALASRAPGGVATGRITFTSPHALRGVPFRVICMLGLDDGSLPRKPAALEFDLMQRHPRGGDRDLRHEDRGAFLDALLAAGECFWLAYNGRSARDNATLPPAVPVSELVDCLGHATHGGRTAWLAAHRQQHALQGFAPGYFDGSMPRSYAADRLPAAHTAAAGWAARQRTRPLLQEPLPVPADDTQPIALDELIAFWRNPVRALLRRRLGIRLPDDTDEILSADEPFILERNWALDEHILRLHQSGLPAEQIAPLLGADPRLPRGEPGRIAASGRLQRLLPLAERYRALRRQPPQTRAFRLRVGDQELHGSLEDLAEDGLLQLSLSPRGWHNVLPMVIRHAVLCALRPAGVALQSRLLSADGLSIWNGDDSGKLPVLVAGYRQGLRQPHPFRPKSAYAFCLKPDKAEQRALAVWRGSQDKAGENTDAWLRLLYGETPDDLPEGFAETALQVYGPLPDRTP
jgi:exodeoxyribonuclease V gamma subunit